MMMMEKCRGGKGRNRLLKKMEESGSEESDSVMNDSE
jgi:hypothetical protein